MIKIPDISFIIVNFNGIIHTRELLLSICNEIFGLNYEVIIVDNGSSGNDYFQLVNEFPNFIHIRSDINLGFAGGNNIGIKSSSGRYLMLINNDTLIPDRSLPDLVKFMDDNPKIGAASPKILYLNPPNTIQFAGFTELSKYTLRNHGLGYNEPDSGQHNTPRKTAFIHGAAVIIRREVIKECGFMPEEYFLYYEEIDWSYRIREKGYELWYFPGTKIIHKESQSIGKNSGIKVFYMTRNRLLLAKRNRKGFVRVVAILYQLFIAIPINIFSQMLNLRFDLIKFTLKGAVDFFKT